MVTHSHTRWIDGATSAVYYLLSSFTSTPSRGGEHHPIVRLSILCLGASHLWLCNNNECLNVCTHPYLFFLTMDVIT